MYLNLRWYKNSSDLKVEKENDFKRLQAVFERWLCLLWNGAGTLRKWVEHPLTFL